MSVVFYRIDDRLIHGQVMTGWSKKYNADRIIVVDDASAAGVVQVLRVQLHAVGGEDLSVGIPAGEPDIPPALI